MAWSAEVDEEQKIGGDRRVDRRYGIQLELKWKLIRRRKLQDAGVGRTLDLSSGGIRFDATRQLPVGLNVELSIAWPALLHNVAPMQLMISGKIVRASGSQVAVHVTQHEFRTAGVPVEQREVLSMASRGPGLLMSSNFSGFGRTH